VSKDEGVLVIRLQHGRANAIDRAFLRHLNMMMDRAGAARGLVFIGTGRFFSPGLDLKEVYPFSREEMRAFMRGFIQTVRRVFEWPAPTVAVLNGHALGGGFLLALACDARLAQDDELLRIGFPDVEKQVPLSHSLRLMALHALPPGEATLVTGAAINVPPLEALRRGLVDDVIRGDEQALLAAAQAWIERQGKEEVASKAERLRPLRDELETLGDEDVAYFLDQWFAPETRAMFGRVWKRLMGRETP